MNRSILFVATTTPLLALLHAALALGQAPAIPRTEVVRVDAHFANTDAMDCRLEATVRGRITVVYSTTRANQVDHYQPRLEIDSTVSCPGPVHRRVQGFVSDAARTPAELTDAIRQAARVMLPGPTMLCSYTPAYTFDGHAVSGETFARECEAHPRDIARTQ